MRLIIFDVDGTLVDSQHMIVAAQTLAFVRLGVAVPSRQTMLSIVGLSLNEGFAHIFGPDAPLDSMSHEYKRAWRELVEAGQSSPLYPGAAELLHELAQRPEHYLAVATGKSRRGIVDLLDQHGWHQLFASVQTADDAPSKPAPDMIVQAMAALDCAAADCVMIGDTQFDMEMAKHAGVRGIGVTWGFHSRAQLNAADVLVDDFAALARAIG